METSSLFMDTMSAISLMINPRTIKVEELWGLYQEPNKKVPLHPLGPNPIVDTSKKAA